MDLVTAAGLDAAEDGEEAVGAGPLGGGQAADEVLLAPGARGEVVDAAGGRLKGELFAGPPVASLDVLAQQHDAYLALLEQLQKE